MLKLRCKVVQVLCSTIHVPSLVQTSLVKVFELSAPPWGLDGKSPGSTGYLDLHKLLQWGCQREDKELLPRSQLCHQGKRQCTTAIITVWLESSCM